MAFVDLLKRKGLDGFGARSTAAEVVVGKNMNGKVVLITGVASGLGMETARVMAEQGARIIGLARTRAKALDAIEQLNGEGHVPVGCDLSVVESIVDAGQTVSGLNVPLDVVVFNAGVMSLPTLELVEGHEAQFFVNHMGHFGLFRGLRKQLAESCRVVVVSSEAHRRTYAGGLDWHRCVGEGRYVAFRAYGMSKLANLLFARQLNRLLDGNGEAFSLHPGVIHTPLMRHLPAVIRAAMRVLRPVFFKSVEQGAATTCFVSTSKAVDGLGGSYFRDCREVSPSRYGRSGKLAVSLWEYSENWWEGRLVESQAATHS